MVSLPVDAHLPEIAAALAERRAVVVVADPGAGKTTRVPPALLDAGPLLLLQPRRAAARAIARRIADERGWTLGRHVGWHIRFDRKFTPATRLIVATEGILTARLQQDPLLSTFGTIVLDEFHERSIHGDLGVALARQAWLARPDLRIVVMSATLDAGRVAAFLDDCPVIRVAGAVHPITTSYHPGRTVQDAVPELLASAAADLLCFLPGRFEIDRAVSDLRSVVSNVDVLPLHGALPPNEQDRAISPGPDRRVIVATNIAETSVTVPGVRVVIDAGLQKVARYDADRAIDSLVTERITKDAADQRAGRAGRLGPGVVWRLWDERDRLRPHREPDVHRVDLSATLLEIASWGGDPRRFEWFETPRSEAIEGAMALLQQLGGLDGGRVTAVGRAMNRLPVHPRLGRILIAGDGHREVCRACALLSDRSFLPARRGATTSDVLSALDGWRDASVSVQQLARDLERACVDAGITSSPAGGSSEDEFRHALLAGYPDRVAQRRRPDSREVKLATGTGAVLAPESGVVNADLMIAIDVQASDRDPSAARVRMASAIEKEWLTPTSREVTHWLDESFTVRASLVERYHALSLGETPMKVDDEAAAAILARAWLEREPSGDDRALLRRTRFAGLAFTAEESIARAAYGRRRLADIRLVEALPDELKRRLATDAPERLTVPSGRDVILEYNDDGTVSASVKLQELFGLAETPRIGPRREPVILSLLAPNGRPVQVTRDLRSFWDRTYPEVRKELRGRYPRHPWPEDPWNAAPTARAKRRGE